MTRHRFDNLERRLLRAVRGDDYTRREGECRLAPEWLILCINNFCNLHCRMCDVGLGASDTVFYANLIGDHPQNMSLDLLNTILDQAAVFRPAPRIGLAYTEPLIHARILDFCEAIARRRQFVSITTNGYLLPKLAGDLVACGVDHITVSVDGSEAVHDRVRRCDGSFSRLYEGVETLNQAKSKANRQTPVVQFSYTLTDENYTDMVNFVKQVAPLQPDRLVFSHLNFISAEMAHVHNMTYQRDLRVVRSNLGDMDLGGIVLADMGQALRELKAYVGSMAKPPRLTIVPDLSDLRELEVFYRKPLTFIGSRRCTDPWRLMMIKTDGVVIPAHGRCFNFPVGRVTDRPLKEIWNSDRYLELRGILKSAGGMLAACSRCCRVIGKPR